MRKFASLVLAACMLLSISAPVLAQEAPEKAASSVDAVAVSEAEASSEASALSEQASSSEAASAQAEPETSSSAPAQSEESEPKKPAASSEAEASSEAPALSEADAPASYEAASSEEASSEAEEASSSEAEEQSGELETSAMTSGNDTLDTATVIDVNQEYSGSMTAGSYNPVTQAEIVDIDYYKFTVPSQGFVTVELTNRGAVDPSAPFLVVGLAFGKVNGSIPEMYEAPNAYFSDADGVTVGYSSKIGIEPGTYYVQLENSNYAVFDYLIKVNFTVSDICETEKNDTAATADTIDTDKTYNASIGKTYTTNSADYTTWTDHHDEDWFKFTITENSTVNVVLTSASNYATDWMLEWGTVSGGTLNAVASVANLLYPGRNTLGAQKLVAPGTYYICIPGDAVYSSMDYDLRVHVTPSSVAPSPSAGGVEGFVERLYSVALGRTPDPTGMADWVNRLKTGAATGAEVARGFILSEEFKQKNLSDSHFLNIMYRTFFDRAADPNGKEYWTDALTSGVSREYVLRGFAESDEFGRLCQSFGITRGSITLTQPRDQNAQLTAFVNRLYTELLMRGGEEDGLNNWCAAILGRTQTPKQVAHGFVFSDEFVNSVTDNSDFVYRMYRTFLGRDPDGPGMNDWLNRLANGQTREQVFNGFADSVEFAEIVAGFGL